METDIDPSQLINQANAAYRPFEAFSDWAKCAVDESRWQPYRERLRTIKSTLDQGTPDARRILDQAFTAIKRLTAQQTGVIETLYPSDRGFTFTAAVSMAVWEAELGKRNDHERNLIEAQLAAYDLVLDFANQQSPIIEAWVRELHAVMCAAQDTYKGYTDAGWVDLALPKGVYKALPNHVQITPTEIHAYAPVEMVSIEMLRLCTELQTIGFLTADPLMQAAYVHHAFVAIHPFTDGNGRVARALASVFTYRAFSIPLLITEDKRDVYFAALALADQREYQPFVDFILVCAIDTVDLLCDSMETVKNGTLDNYIRALHSVYKTPSGHSHSTVDDIGYTFFDLVFAGFQKTVAGLDLASGELQIGVTQVTGDLIAELYKDESRWPVIKKRRAIKIHLETSEPARATTDRMYYLEVPKVLVRDEEFIVQGGAPEWTKPNREMIGAKMHDIVPRVSLALEMRALLFAEKVISRAVAELLEQTRNQLKRAGY